MPHRILAKYILLKVKIENLNKFYSNGLQKHAKKQSRKKHMVFVL